MLRRILLPLVAVVVALATSSKAHAYGAAHVGYTHVGPSGVQHCGATAATGPYGSYAGAHGSVHTGVGGASAAGSGAYRAAANSGAYGGAYHYSSSPYGGTAAGGYHYGTTGGGYSAGVYRGY